MSDEPSGPGERDTASIRAADSLMPELVSGFVDVDGAGVDDLIVRSLGRVALQMGADRAVYACLTPDGRRVARTHAWGDDPPGGAGPDSYAIDAFPWIARHFFAKHRILYVPDFAALSEKAAADLEAWGTGVPAAAFIAGYGDRDPVGVIVLQWWTRSVSLEERDLRPLGILADVIAAALRRKQAQRAYREMEKRLRHAERLGFVERLAGGVAHDFNNVLSVILGAAERAGDASPGGSTAAAQLSEIVRAVARAKEMVDRLLALSRPEPGEPRPVDASALVSGLDSILRTFIGDRFELRIRAGAGVPHVRIDPAALQRVVLSLVVNACDAVPQGGALRIECVACNADGRECAAGESPSWMRISLTASATGMREALPGDAAAHSPADGFAAAEGPGIADCQEIVAHAAGRVAVRSRPAHETRFDVLLPATTLPLARAAGATPPATPLADRGETILLVEDEPDVRRAAGHVLRARGYRVVEAPDGEVAWWLLTGTLGDEVALVITDVVMPNLSGTRLAERLHASRPETKVLFVSGYSDDPALARERASSPNCVLAKPFTGRELAARVREILDDDPMRAKDAIPTGDR